MAKVWGDFPRVYEAAHRDSSSWKGIVLLYLYNSVAEQYTLAYKEIIWGCIDHPWDHVEGVHKSWFPATSKRLYKHEPLTFHPDRPNSLLFVFWLKGTLPNLDVQLSDCGCFLQKGIVVVVVVVVVVLDLFSICCFCVLTNCWSSAASSPIARHQPGLSLWCQWLWWLSTWHQLRGAGWKVEDVMMSWYQNPMMEVEFIVPRWPMLSNLIDQDMYTWGACKMKEWQIFLLTLLMCFLHMNS